jgi:tRNA threonylcarbamoyladenosine biosynthesis protein TsaE
MLLTLDDESATLELGKSISKYCPNNAFSIHLEGELGAGKTTLTRGLLTALGHQHHVKSPTYTLVEHYQLNGRNIYHFDLYRLADPEELDYIGLDDYLDNDALCLIEWPAQGGNYLPSPDLIISLQYQSTGRQVSLTPVSEQAQILCQRLSQDYSSSSRA